MAEEKQIFTLRDAQKFAGPVSFTTMLKPAGSACNLDCSYCYYLDKAAQYGGRQAVMSDDLLETYVRQYIEGNDAQTVTFCWHGGEPTLLGVEWYRKAVALQKKYAGGKTIVNTLQTNGTLIDEEWCDFFAGNNFLIGLSLDGPKSVHDPFRKTKGQEPTWEAVMRAARLMRSRGVQFNTLSVVNSVGEKRGKEIYTFLRDVVGSTYMQFLPAVEHVVKKPGMRRPLIVAPETEGAQMAPWSVSARGYGRFLCDVFDEWVRNDVGRTFVQMFDATLAGWMGVDPGVCTMGETCGEALVVEHNGDVFSCDHFVYPEYKLGNIRETTLREMFESEKRKRFGLAKRNMLPDECLRCGFWRACHGECPKHRFDTGTDGYRKNSLCEGLTMFFRHAAPYMDYMKERLLNQQPPAWVMLKARKEIR